VSSKYARINSTELKRLMGLKEANNKLSRCTLL
jgi:hypothetical protein